MLSLLLPPSLVGLIAGIVLLGGTLAAGLAFIPIIVLKLLLPFAGARRACTEVMFSIAHHWSLFNRVVYRLLYPVSWEIDQRGALDPHKSYLLICNHQSIIDILLMFDQFHTRTPPLCFFLKNELLWVPVIGWACWGMDFPFMKRSGLASDLAATRQFCERFRNQPITVVNFAEGTRFSEGKRVSKKSPYRHLLRPKAAGLSYTLNAMGEQFDGVIDVTIAYRPSRFPPVWSFLTGEQTQLSIVIDVLPVPAELMAGDYLHDPVYRERCQNWINTLWQRKDARLERMITRRPAGAARPRLT